MDWPEQIVEVDAEALIDGGAVIVAVTAVLELSHLEVIFHP